MQRLLLAFLFGFTLFLQSADLSAQNGANKAIKTVLERIELQKAAWNNGDLEGFMDYYWKSDELQFISASGVTKGWLATLDRYRKSYPDREAMGQLEFEIISADQRSKKVVTIGGKYILTVANKNIVGYFLLVWEKRGKDWVIVVDSTN